MMLTTKELAGVLKKSQSTIRAWADEGAIPVMYVKGRRNKFRMFDLDSVKAALSADGAKTADEFFAKVQKS